jgi:hypothetical protein
VQKIWGYKQYPDDIVIAAAIATITVTVFIASELDIF